MTPVWKEQPERSQPWVLSLMIWIAVNLGRGTARALLIPIVIYFYLTAPYARHESRRYLALALGRSPRALDVLRQLHCFAACLLDRVFFLTGRWAALDVEVFDSGEVLQHADAGRGALMLTAHFGSFDAMRVLGRERKDLRVRIVMDRGQNRMLMSALERLNPFFADEIIDAAAGPAAMLAVRDGIEAGCLVGVMADRMVGTDPGIAVQFLGRRARLPTSPWRLAAVTGAPIELCFGLYLGGNRYAMHLESFCPASTIAPADRRQWMSRQAQAYAMRLEHHVRCAPYNWFNFFDFWSNGPARD